MINEEKVDQIRVYNGTSFVMVKQAEAGMVVSLKGIQSLESGQGIGFEEGVIAPANVLEAHTAWLSAQSEKIDAQIDIKLTEIYLQKSLGTLK